MWRAGGIVLLFCSQELAAPLAIEEHEFSLRPPSGWTARPGLRPTVVKFVRALEGKPDAELLVTHLMTTNPTPLEGFKTQARAHIAERYKDARVLEERTLTLAGRPAWQIAFVHKGVVHVKVAIHRTHLEYYVLDALLAESEAARLRPGVEASIASFAIVPVAPTPEEQTALRRTKAVLAGLAVDPAAAGERWYTLHLGGRRAGHQRTKLEVVDGRYALEAELVLDLGDGNKDASTVKGTFTPDGRVQTLETVQTKENDKKERWLFKSSATLEGGRLRVRRDMNGLEEETTLQVEEGAWLADLGDALRPFIARHGRGTYALKTLSPFSDEANLEQIEAGVLERLKVDGREREVLLVQAVVDRRRTMTYFYGPDARLVRLGGEKDVFLLREATREEAEPGKK
ncbi:MAG TPA: hypothetical protein VEJ18_16925 [Planctomycetota bacterium]|nr:hypothetical protein [Planctomycetota bacterium]